MPTRPKKSKLGQTLKGRKAQDPVKRERVRSKDEYHSYRWTRASKIFRAEHPLCSECKSKGIIQEAEVVDHIVPVAICKDFWDSSNWQSLCSKCNIAKGNRDKRLIREHRR